MTDAERARTDPTRCSGCGAELDERPDLAVQERVPCPSCGSLSRASFVCVSETITIREKVRMKGRRGGRGRPFVEQTSGDDLHRASGKWTWVARLYDHENDWYCEHITDPETGQVVRHFEEPLSQHQGHVAAVALPRASMLTPRRPRRRRD